MNPELEKILADSGVDKIYYYFINSPIVNNAFTVCVFINSLQKRIEARGVSICSLKDTFSKNEGKNKAFGRAVKALIKRSNNWKIKGSSRDREFTKRTFTVKNKSDLNRFKEEIVPELKKVDPNMTISVMQNGPSTKYIYDVPMSYPVRLANDMFRYKSQYRPAPVNKEELNLINETMKIFSNPIVDEKQTSTRT